MALLVAPATASAANTFVNGTTGDDGNDCQSATVGVSPIGPCLTIQAGINKAGNNDTITVAPGTYSESLLPSGSGKNLTASGSAPATIIDGGGSTAIEVTGSDQGTISGFTIRSSGLAVLLNNDATVSGNIFDSTDDSSIGVNVAGTGNPDITGNIFSDDGVGSRTGVTSTADSTVTSNSFQDLSTPVDILAGTSTSVSGNHISGTHGFGSSISIASGTGNVNAYIADNVINNPGGINTTGIQVVDSAGGAMADATLQRNQIFDQSLGVVANSADGTVTLEGDVISSDNPNAYGLWVLKDNVSATNVTIWDNGTTDIDIGGVPFTMGASIIEKPISGNTGSTCTITNSRGPAGGSGFTGCGNFVTNADPRFSNPATDDFLLVAPSPMIDQGGPANNAMYDMTSLGSTTRNEDGACPVGAARDIGADEYNPPFVLGAGDCDPEAAPTVNEVNPAGPANNNTPYVQGSGVPANSLVTFYNGLGCTSDPQGQVVGSLFNTTGGPVVVADNSVTDLYATTTTIFGITSPCSSTFAHYVEDSTKPSTSITSRPHRTIRTSRRSVSVKFRFSGGSGAHFKCKIDSKAYGACSSPKSYRLRRGSHRFRVYAVDAAGNVDTSPSSFSFRIKKR